MDVAERDGFARYLARYAGLYGAHGCLSPLRPNLMAALSLAALPLAHTLRRRRTLRRR